MKGFAGQQKLGTQEYATIVPVGSSKYAIDMAPKALFPTSMTPFAVVSAVYGKFVVNGIPSQEMRIEITAHGARSGDVLRFDSGPLTSIEASIIRVEDANTVVISLQVDPADAIASTCLVMRHITLTLDSSGSLVTTSGPLQYIYDGASEEVEEDTADATNNRALPTKNFYDLDGVQTPVSRDTADETLTTALPSLGYFVRDGVVTPIIKDTVTPANTRPIPIELVSSTGNEATINVTTGDLGVEISHDGATHTWDSTRLGDGTTLARIRPDAGDVGFGDVQTVDRDLNLVVGEQADTAETDPTQTDTLMAFTKGQLQVLNAIESNTDTSSNGLATEAKQDDQITLLTTMEANQDAQTAILTDIETNTDPATNGQATEAKQDDNIVQTTALNTVTGLQADASETDHTATASLMSFTKGQVELLGAIAQSVFPLNTTEDYYRRDFTSSPLTTASGFVTLRVLSADINRVKVTNNSGNELVIRNLTQGTGEIIIGQGAVFEQELLGSTGDTLQISAITADAIDGIVYINFEG